MSESKPEKVDITIGSKGSKSNEDKSSKETKSAKTEGQGPAITNFRNKRSVGKEPEKKTAGSDKKEPNLWQKSDIDSVADQPAEADDQDDVLEHPDVKDLDGGFSADMYPPGQTFTPEKEGKRLEPESSEENNGSPQKQEEKDSETAEANQGEEEQSDTDIEENDNLYHRDADFYSSKFNPDNPEANQQAPPKRKNTGKRTQLITLMFLLVLLGGLGVLYYLEMQNPGSGLIFDLVEDFYIW